MGAQNVWKQQSQTSWNMQHLYCPHVTFKTPNSSPHLWNPFGNPPTLHPTFNKGENTHAHASLSSCVIIKLFWTSHWKSNATCVSTRQMYCSWRSAPISSLIQPFLPYFQATPNTIDLTPQPSASHQHWQHPPFWSVIPKSEYLAPHTNQKGQTECIFIGNFQETTYYSQSIFSYLSCSKNGASQLFFYPNVKQISFTSGIDASSNICV